MFPSKLDHSKIILPPLSHVTTQGPVPETLRQRKCRIMISNIELPSPQGLRDATLRCVPLEPRSAESVIAVIINVSVQVRSLEDYPTSSLTCYNAGSRAGDPATTEMSNNEYRTSVPAGSPARDPALCAHRTPISRTSNCGNHKCLQTGAKYSAHKMPRCCAGNP